jgi:predicted metal-dependent hydrolase
MKSQITLDGITIEVVRKKVKNLNLTVRPPHGEVRISAPRRVSSAEIRAFALSKREWIRKHQERMRERAIDPSRDRSASPEYMHGESLPVWGQAYPLAVSVTTGSAHVEWTRDRPLLKVRPGATVDERRSAVEAWYRDQVRSAVPSLLERWEPELGVKVGGVQVRRMKTRWGSCTPTRRTIRLNSELAARPPELLEYILVHELVHLLEPSHNGRFYALMDRYLPDWRERKAALEGKG